MNEIKTPTRIVDEIKYYLQKRHPGIRDFSDFSMNSILTEAIAIQVYLLYKAIYQKGLDLSIMTATGKALDALVVDRLPDGRYPGAKSVGHVTFKRVDGAPTTISIPAGTIVARSADSYGPVYFVTTASCQLLQDETEVTVDARAQEAGERGNVAAYTIDLPITPIPGIHQVENRLPFDGGTDFESDADLTDRYIYTVWQPGRATVETLEEHIKAISSTVREVKVFSLGFGDVEIVVDSSDDIEDPPAAIWQAIRENLAAGCTSIGVIGARLGPDGNQFGLEDTKGGKIFIRPTETTANTDDVIPINYLDMPGRNRSGTVHVPERTPRGLILPVTLEEETDLATTIISADYDDDNKYDILMGLGEPPYLYIMPELVNVSISVKAKLTDTPEENLLANVEQSLRDCLNAYAIGLDAEYSDIEKFIHIDYSSRREFVGLDEIQEFKIIVKGVELVKFGDNFDIENDEKIVAGAITLEEVE